MDATIVSLAQRAILLTVIISAPPILAALTLGLVLAVLQALTQIQEQTLQIAARLVAVFAMILLFGLWMASQVIAFARTIFENFGTWVG